MQNDLALGSFAPHTRSALPCTGHTHWLKENIRATPLTARLLSNDDDQPSNGDSDAVHCAKRQYQPSRVRWYAYNIRAALA